MKNKIIWFIVFIVSVPLHPLGENAGKNTLEEFEKRSKVIGVNFGTGLAVGIGTIAVVAKACQLTCSWSYNYLFPSPLQKALQTRDKLEQCLVTHKEQGTFGMSDNCIDQAYAYSVARARADIQDRTDLPKTQDIINGFTDYTRQKS